MPARYAIDNAHKPDGIVRPSHRSGKNPTATVRAISVKFPRLDDGIGLAQRGRKRGGPKADRAQNGSANPRHRLLPAKSVKVPRRHQNYCERYSPSRWYERGRKSLALATAA